MPANDEDRLNEEDGPALRRWFAPAFAACLVAAAALWLWPGAAADLTYDIAPGETRTIALGEGSTITLSGVPNSSSMATTRGRLASKAGKAFSTFATMKPILSVLPWALPRSSTPAPCSM